MPACPIDGLIPELEFFFFWITKPKNGEAALGEVL